VRNGESAFRLLYRWYQLIIDNKSWLARLMTIEQGKPLKEAEGEVDYAASFINGLPSRASARTGNHSAGKTWFTHSGNA
jgi:succinate-semialdehyde dehydrogenase/glutarate-semialdehyde dehydrogenase